jgi:glycosyltransferase involved in cell wall biosynthesis
MSARVPVVATSVGGVPEIVSQDVTGILFAAPPRAEELASALRPLLADPELRKRLGEGGRRRFEANFTTDRWIERSLPVYESVIAAPATAAAG